MSLEWKCTFCGNRAEYHWCVPYTNNKHIYFCNDCMQQHSRFRPITNEQLLAWLKKRPKHHGGWL